MTSRSAGSSSPTSRTTPREIELTSYAEVVMAPQEADLAHRAFSNLFVSTEILPEYTAILCHRRPRSPGEQAPGCSNSCRRPSRSTSRPLTRPTARASWAAAGRRRPLPPWRPAPARRTSREHRGPVLDPIVAIRAVLTLPPDESRTAQVISGVAETREGALTTIRKYHDRHFVDRAFEMAWFESQEVLRLAQHHRGRRPDLRPSGHLGHLRQLRAPRLPRHHRPQPARASPVSGASASRATCP